MKRYLTFISAACMTAVLYGCAGNNSTKNKAAAITLLATSDLHGMMTDWNYLQDQAVETGSAVRLSTAIREKRNDHTILIDAGDTVQGNSANIFIDEPVHPMMQWLNAMNYDIWVIGNHEFEYRMDTAEKVIASFEGTVLTGNVFRPDGSPAAEAAAIIEVNGIKAGFIGMTSPVIRDYTRIQNSGYQIKDPIEETKKAITVLEGKADVLIAVCHMGTNHSISENDTSVYELADACPELDVIIASHEHRLIEEECSTTIS